MGQPKLDMLDDLRIGVPVVEHPRAEQLPDAKQVRRRVLIVDRNENTLIALNGLRLYACEKEFSRRANPG